MTAPRGRLPAVCPTEAARSPKPRGGGGGGGDEGPRLLTSPPKPPQRPNFCARAQVLDSDRSGGLDSSELCAAMRKLVRRARARLHPAPRRARPAALQSRLASNGEGVGGRRRPGPAAVAERLRYQFFLVAQTNCKRFYRGRRRPGPAESDGDGGVPGGSVAEAQAKPR